MTDLSTIRTRTGLTLVATIGGLLTATTSAAEFGYSGDAGPAFWGEIDPAWEACAGGDHAARQSPIDIRRITRDATLEPLELNVLPMEVELINSGEESHSSRTINLAQALHRPDAYCTYSGSLTTPPCSEIVNWVVLKSQGSLSPRQFRAFRDVLGNDLRPLHSHNGRLVRGTDDRRRADAATGA